MMETQQKANDCRSRQAPQTITQITRQTTTQYKKKAAAIPTKLLFHG